MSWNEVLIFFAYAFLGSGAWTAHMLIDRYYNRLSGRKRFAASCISKSELTDVISRNQYLYPGSIFAVSVAVVVGVIFS